MIALETKEDVLKRIEAWKEREKSAWRRVESVKAYALNISELAKDAIEDLEKLAEML